MSKKIKQKQFRTFNLDAGNIDVENRKVNVAFSSENPVERIFGMEVLSHENGSVDLTRLLDGAPLLLQHDPEKQIGVVETASIDPDKIGRATVRFSKSNEAQNIFQDVVDGIRSKVSVGYFIDEISEVKQDKNSPSIFRATKWSPIELSLVSIPADNTVGVGRSENFETEIENEIKNDLTKTKIKNLGEIKMEEIKNIPTNEDVLKNERTRVEEIEATTTKFVGRVAKIDELRSEAVKRGWSIERFKGEIADKLSDGKPFETPNSDLGLSEKEKKNFSLRNLILTQVANTGVKADFERECSNEVVRRTGKAPRGLYMPYDIQTRDLLAGSGSGANIVGTALKPESFIEMLYNNQMLEKLGVQRISGLNQNIAIPKQTAKSTSYWVSENSAVTESAPNYAQQTLSPKTVGALVDYSRNLLLQGLPSIENLVASDIAKSLAIAVDAAAFHGTGSSGEPTGLASFSGVGGVTITANAVTWSNILEFESDVLGQNADVTNCAFVTTPAIQAILKAKAKVSGDSRDFVQSGNSVNGYNLYPSNQISSGHLFFGNFRDFLIAEWGNGIDILVDPYTGSSAGTYRVVSFMSVDMAPRHAGSFSFASGITS